jgi:hypothetical protein
MEGRTEPGARAASSARCDDDAYSCRRSNDAMLRRSAARRRETGRMINVLGWLTTAVIFAATIGLVVTWIM